MTQLHIKCNREQCQWFIKFIGIDSITNVTESPKNIQYVHGHISYQLIFMMNGEEHFSEVYYTFEDFLKNFKIDQPFYQREKKVGHKSDSSFNAALELMKSGKSVKRMLSSNNLSLVLKTDVSYSQLKTHLGKFASDEKVGKYPFKFVLKNEKGHMINDNYSLTAEDVLAEDWHETN